MSGVRWLAAWAALSFSMAVQAATISLSHHEPLQRLSISGASVDGSQKIGVAGPVEMKFDALGRSFELQLSPNGRLLDAARDLAGNSVIPYRGKLAGNDSSWVRIVIADGVPSGLIWDGSELLAIERPGDNVAGADSTIIYRLADAFRTAAPLTSRWSRNSMQPPRKPKVRLRRSTSARSRMPNLQASTAQTRSRRFWRA